MTPSLAYATIGASIIVLASIFQWIVLDYLAPKEDGQ